MNCFFPTIVLWKVSQNFFEQIKFKGLFTFKKMFSVFISSFYFQLDKKRSLEELERENIETFRVEEQAYASNLNLYQLLEE